ncbi:hypothetical protein [uncultured Aquimarina sp.]|uniref:hypothetical protein n=1 Tax=uncultured Aquimarina sp. TaxID=575652 RepID=UPI002610D95F|nr:hypothetical protein [uncultured Aquimarina sp.]
MKIHKVKRRNKTNTMEASEKYLKDAEHLANSLEDNSYIVTLTKENFVQLSIE